MKVSAKNVFIALAITGAVVILWFLARESRTDNLDAQLAFDFEQYLNSVNDSTNWDNYEPLSLEIPE